MSKMQPRPTVEIPHDLEMELRHLGGDDIYDRARLVVLRLDHEMHEQAEKSPLLQQLWDEVKPHAKAAIVALLLTALDAGSDYVAGKINPAN